MINCMLEVKTQLKVVLDEPGYPLLSGFTMDVLCIPASSAPAERTCSSAGESTSGRRNRLSEENLEREKNVLKIVYKYFHTL